MLQSQMGLKTKWHKSACAPLRTLCTPSQLSCVVPLCFVVRPQQKEPCNLRMFLFSSRMYRPVTSRFAPLVTCVSRPSLTLLGAERTSLYMHQERCSERLVIGLEWDTEPGDHSGSEVESQRGSGRLVIGLEGSWQMPWCLS